MRPETKAGRSVDAVGRGRRTRLEGYARWVMAKYRVEHEVGPVHEEPVLDEEGCAQRRTARSALRRRG